MSVCLFGKFPKYPPLNRLIKPAIWPTEEEVAEAAYNMYEPGN